TLLAAPPRGNLLVPAPPPPEPQHHVREQGAVRQERLARQAPAEPDRRERPPAVLGSEPRRAVAPHREARVVAVAVVVVRFPEERQQRALEARAGDILG